MSLTLQESNNLIDKNKIYNYISKNDNYIYIYNAKYMLYIINIDDCISYNDIINNDNLKFIDFKELKNNCHPRLNDIIFDISKY